MISGMRIMHEIPQCPYDYKIWQYSESGEVPGISGNVDLDLWFQEGRIK